MVEDCGASANVAVGRRAAAGSDWSNVRRSMHGIVPEVCAAEERSGVPSGAGNLRRRPGGNGSIDR